MLGYLQCRRPLFDLWAGKIPWRRERLSTPVFWPGAAEQLSPVAQLLSLCSRVCAPQQEKPVQWEAHSLQLEKASVQLRFSKAMKKYIKIFVAFFAGKPLRDSAPVVLVTWSHVHPLPHLQNSTFWKGKQVVTINHIFTVYTKLLIFNQLENRSRQQPWFNLAIQPF